VDLEGVEERVERLARDRVVGEHHGDGVDAAGDRGVLARRGFRDQRLALVAAGARHVLEPAHLGIRAIRLRKAAQHGLAARASALEEHVRMLGPEGALGLRARAALDQLVVHHDPRHHHGAHPQQRELEVGDHWRNGPPRDECARGQATRGLRHGMFI